MGIAYNTSVVLDGLTEVVDPVYATGSTTDVLTNKFSRTVITAFNYSTSTSLPINTFLSNVDATGAGSSNITLTRNTALETGSITVSLWFNLNNIPIEVGANNNWRTAFSSNNGTGASPLSFILEQNSFMNFTTSTTTGLRRYLNSNFNPYQVTANGWQNLVFTYNSSTGVAACYKNNSLVLSGPMTTDAIGTSPTGAGDALTYTTYQTNGLKLYGGATSTADPNGNGFVPGLAGVTYIYNRALTAAEVSQNFQALRGRYGI